MSHLSQEPLPINQTRRKLTVFLAAPPGDGLRTTRDYFREYVKPVLVAAALDYDVIEGRKEGDVRYGAAEQIRRLRRKNGEAIQGPNDEMLDPERLIESTRTRMSVQEEPGPRGDLVIGRHTWKEYVRGIHEGWLGPIHQPASPQEEQSPPSQTGPSLTQESQSSTFGENSEPQKNSQNENAKSADEQSPGNPENAQNGEPDAVDERASYLPTSAYTTSSLAPTAPHVFEASIAIPQPHILGFFNTPIRIYRYLNQRSLADMVGHETAAIALAMSVPYDQHTKSNARSSTDLSAKPISTLEITDPVEIDGNKSSQFDLQSVLQHEEKEWHKSIHKPRDDGRERTWLEDIVVDKRIAEKMRNFRLGQAEEERAERLTRGVEKPLHDQGESEDRKVLIGNLDDAEA